MSTHLSPDHVAAIERERRVVVNFDAFPSMMHLPTIDVEHMKAALFEFIDNPQTRVDSVWWNFTEGNEAYWPSKILPFIEAPPYGEWAQTGFDPVQTLLEETRRRELETFFTYRINGSDNDVPGRTPRLAAKEEHPDWLIHTWNKTIGDATDERLNGYWNFAVQGVREYKLSILEEIAGQYDYDGMEIDFARVCPVLPPGKQWEHRDALTEFMRSVRSMLLRVGERRGRPYLLAARVPENLVGCRMDGLDVETWAREELVDIFTLGCRSFDVDIAAFRRITERTHIKLYPVLDDHHSTDGYQFPPIEVFRGVMANWLHQGADGLQTFNFAYARSEDPRKVRNAGHVAGMANAPPVLPRACRHRRHESKEQGLCRAEARWRSWPLRRSKPRGLVDAEMDVLQYEHVRSSARRARPGRAGGHPPPCLRRRAGTTRCGGHGPTAPLGRFRRRLA